MLSLGSYRSEKGVGERSQRKSSDEVEKLGNRPPDAASLATIEELPCLGNILGHLGSGCSAKVIQTGRAQRRATTESQRGQQH
jgi:hypothetical protein